MKQLNYAQTQQSPLTSNNNDKLNKTEASNNESQINKITNQNIINKLKLHTHSIQCFKICKNLIPWKFIPKPQKISNDNQNKNFKIKTKNQTTTRKSNNNKKRKNITKKKDRNKKKRKIKNNNENKQTQPTTININTQQILLSRIAITITNYTLINFQ